jgi:glycosyltransferase involved in cell wall biosynthesis
MQAYVRSFAEAAALTSEVVVLSRDQKDTIHEGRASYRRCRTERKALALAEQGMRSIAFGADILVSDQVQSATFGVHVPAKRACFVHAAELTGGGHKRLKTAVLRRQARLWGPTRWVCDYAIEHFGVEASVPRVLTPPVDCSVFRPVEPEARRQLRTDINLDVDRPVVICIARLEHISRYKGIDLTIEACGLIADLEPQLVVIGEGDDLPRLRSLATAVDVVFTGSLSRDILPHYLAAADVFAMPSHAASFGAGIRTEGFGIVYLEAAASGVPVVKGTAPGTREAVLEGVTGVTAEPSAEAVAHALRQLLEADEAARVTTAKRCREWALKFDQPVFEQCVRDELALL